MASITREECQRTHETLNSTLTSIRDDIKNIGDNHLVHLNDKIDNMQNDNNKKFTDMQKAIIVVFFVSSLALGIRVGEILGLIP